MTEQRPQNETGRKQCQHNKYEQRGHERGFPKEEDSSVLVCCKSSVRCVCSSALRACGAEYRDCSRRWRTITIRTLIPISNNSTGPNHSSKVTGETRGR